MLEIRHEVRRIVAEMAKNISDSLAPKVQANKKREKTREGLMTKGLVMFYEMLLRRSVTTRAGN